MATIDTLGPAMLRFAASIENITTPDAVLDALHHVSWTVCKLGVMGASLLPVRWGHVTESERGRTLFVHKSVPEAWWQEWFALSRRHPSPGATLTRLALAPYTTAEMMRTLEPIGVDRWAEELALKHGFRDRLICPVGGRWVVVYWSRKVLTLSPEERALLFMGASFAAIRLQQLAGPHVVRLEELATLTPRELAVLRLFSLGHLAANSATALGISEETVRTHLKKAQRKLGVSNRTHAVAQAIRLQLIP